MTRGFCVWLVPILLLVLAPQDAQAEYFLRAIGPPHRTRVAADVCVAVTVQDKREERSGLGSQLWALAPLVPYAQGTMTKMRLGFAEVSGLPVADYSHVLGLLVAKAIRVGGVAEYARYETDRRNLNQYELVLKMIFNQFSYSEGMFLYGLSAPGDLLWLIGLPMGRVGCKVDVQYALIEQHTGTVLASGAFNDDTARLVGLYYNGSSLRRGARLLNEELLQRVVTTIWNSVAKGIEHRRTAYWKELRKRHERWRVEVKGDPPLHLLVRRHLLKLPRLEGILQEPSAPPTPALGSKRWALVIGVSKFSDIHIKRLRYAATDAVAFGTWLLNPRGGRYDRDCVKLLIDKDATLQNVREALINWLRHADENDAVTIYFAGHGMPEPGGSLANLFLLTYDTDLERTATTALPMWDLREAIRRYIKARTVLVLVDACHGQGVISDYAVKWKTYSSPALYGPGATARGVGGIVNIKSEGLVWSRGRAGGILVLTASGMNPSVEGDKWGGGVFTHCLIEGLKRKRTLGALISYVSARVQQETDGQQRPTVAGSYEPTMPIIW